LKRDIIKYSNGAVLTSLNVQQTQLGHWRKTNFYSAVITVSKVPMCLGLCLHLSAVDVAERLLHSLDEKLLVVSLLKDNRGVSS